VDSDEQKDTSAVQKAYEDQVNKELSEIAAYREALVQDFMNAEPDEETAEKAAKKLIELVPDAGNTVKYLITHAESEAVRKDLSKWIFQVAMKAAEDKGDEDEMTRLINVLSKASK
jgi:ABC-type ATPase with predicted acetyltransferase domain